MRRALWEGHELRGLYIPTVGGSRAARAVYTRPSAQPWQGPVMCPSCNSKGTRVGAAVGVAVGVTLGASVGDAVGVVDGVPVGAPVGVLVGVVGAEVSGAAVGIVVGGVLHRPGIPARDACMHESGTALQLELCLDLSSQN